MKKNVKFLNYLVWVVTEKGFEYSKHSVAMHLISKNFQLRSTATLANLKAYDKLALANRFTPPDNGQLLQRIADVKAAPNHNSFGYNLYGPLFLKSSSSTGDDATNQVELTFKKTSF